MYALTLDFQKKERESILDNPLNDKISKKYDYGFLVKHNKKPTHAVSQYLQGNEPSTNHQRKKEFFMYRTPHDKEDPTGRTGVAIGIRTPRKSADYGRSQSTMNLPKMPKLQIGVSQQFQASGSRGRGGAVTDRNEPNYPENSGMLSARTPQPLRKQQGLPNTQQ